MNTSLFFRHVFSSHILGWFSTMGLLLFQADILISSQLLVITLLDLQPWQSWTISWWIHTPSFYSLNRKGKKSSDLVYCWPVAFNKELPPPPTTATNGAQRYSNGSNKGHHRAAPPLPPSHYVNGSENGACFYMYKICSTFTIQRNWTFSQERMSKVIQSAEFGRAKFQNHSGTDRKSFLCCQELLSKMSLSEIGLWQFSLIYYVAWIVQLTPVWNWLRWSITWMSIKLFSNLGFILVHWQSELGVDCKDSNTNFHSLLTIPGRFQRLSTFIKKFTSLLVVRVVHFVMNGIIET